MTRTRIGRRELIALRSAAAHDRRQMAAAGQAIVRLGLLLKGAADLLDAKGARDFAHLCRAEGDRALGGVRDACDGEAP